MNSYYFSSRKTRMYLLGFLLCSLVLQVSAQKKKVPCNKTLEISNKEYEAGNFASTIKMLTGCIGTFNTQESIEANRLLALCQLGMNNETKALEASQRLLELKTDYREFPYFDPIEFTKLLARFDIWPKLELGLKAGVGINSIGLGKAYSITGTKQTFSAKFGYQAGIVGEYYLNKKLSINAELLFEGINYTMDATPISNWKQHYVEKMNYITIPVSARYYFYKSKDRVFAIEAGLQTQVLVTTTSNFLFENEKTGFTNQSSAQLAIQRNTLLYYGLTGITAKQKAGVGMFVASIRFAFGLRTVNKADKRYDDMDFVMSNQYVDSDIIFNPLYVTVGYQFPIQQMYKVVLK